MFVTVAPPNSLIDAPGAGGCSAGGAGKRGACMAEEQGVRSTARKRPSDLAKGHPQGHINDLGITVSGSSTQRQIKQFCRAAAYQSGVAAHSISRCGVATCHRKNAASLPRLLYGPGEGASPLHISNAAIRPSPGQTVGSGDCHSA